LLTVVSNMPWSFLAVPVVAFAFVWHLAVRRFNWPMRWW